MGVLLGPVAAVASFLPERVGWSVAAAAALLLYLVQGTANAHRLPQNRRMVPQMLQVAAPERGAAQFGFELGLGFRTYMTTSLPLVMLALVVFWSPGYGTVLLTTVGFGAGRALLPFVRGTDGMVWENEIVARARRFALPLVLVSMVCCGLVLGPTSPFRP